MILDRPSRYPHRTSPRFRPPRQRVDPTLKRHGIIYGFHILDPKTGEIRVDYVGKTFQQLWQREAQHRECQPWSDLIVGRAFVIEEGWWTDGELDDRETLHIARVAPRYNFEKNEHNRHRIPIYEARRQRRRRDAERIRQGIGGVPAWSPTGAPPVLGRYVWPSWLERLARRFRRQLIRLATAVTVWLIVAGASWLLLFAQVPSGVGARNSALTATGALGVWRFRRQIWRRLVRSRRRSRRGRR